MPDLVNSRTTSYSLSTAFNCRRGFVTVGWQAMRFSNEVDTLFWDNVFEASPSVASASDRGRFARGPLDLWPDSTYLRLFAAGAVNLRARTRINATVARGKAEQDDPFLPFTQNEALFFPGPDGILGTPDDIPGTDPALLPAASLDGGATAARTDLRISSRPLDPLTVRGSWRCYEYEDERPQLFFDGYAAFGESFFRRGIGQTAGGSPALFNEPRGYTRTAWSVGGSWRFGRPASLDVEYGSTERKFDERQVEATTEDIAQVRVRFEPLEWLSGRVAWLDASRDFDGDYEVGFELSGVRDFSVWECDRTRLTAEVDFGPGEDSTVGVAYVHWKDDFPGVVTSPAFMPPYGRALPYGLNRAESDSASVSLGYATKRWTFAGSVGRDQSDRASLSVTKTDVAGANSNPVNRWTRRQDDAVSCANIAIEEQVVPDRVRFYLDLGASVYDGDLETANVEAPNLNSAVAVPFPDLETRLYTARLRVRWTLTPGVDFEARYWHEPFRLDDFSWDFVQPSMQGVIEEVRTAPSDVQPAAAQRYLFLDRPYSDYTANVLSALVRVHFGARRVLLRPEQARDADPSVERGSRPPPPAALRIRGRCRRDREPLRGARRPRRLVFGRAAGAAHPHVPGGGNSLARSRAGPAPFRASVQREADLWGFGCATFSSACSKSKPLKVGLSGLWQPLHVLSSGTIMPAATDFARSFMISIFQ